MPIRLNNFLSWVTPRRVWVNDEGTWQSARNVFVNNGGTWQRVFSRGLWTTMTAGSDGSNIGYNRQFSPIPPNPMGTATDITLVDGRTLTAIYWNSAGSSLIVALAGFTSDPLYSYLDNIVINGFGTVTVGDGNFVGYSYGAAAQWTWAISQPFVNGGSYDIEVYTA